VKKQQTEQSDTEEENLPHTPRTLLACDIEGVDYADTKKKTMSDFMGGAKGIKEIAKMQLDFYNKHRTELIQLVKNRREEIS